MRVMLVDDDRFIREDIKSFFHWEKEGFEIVNESNNGNEALSWLRGNTVDIILTDISMPHRNGIELIHALKDIGFPGEIVVMSNYDDFDYVKDAMRLGAFDYCLKYKMTPESLLTLLRKAADDLRTKRGHQSTPQQMRDSLLNDALQGRVVGIAAAETANLLAQYYSLLFLNYAGHFKLLEEEVQYFESINSSVCVIKEKGVVFALPIGNADSRKPSPFLQDAVTIIRRLFPSCILVVSAERTKPESFQSRLLEMEGSALKFFYQEQFTIYNEPHLQWAETIPNSQKHFFENALHSAADAFDLERFRKAGEAAIQSFVVCHLHPKTLCAFFENVLFRVCQKFDLNGEETAFSCASITCLSELRTSLARWCDVFFLIPIATNNYEIISAIHYVHANYMRQLSLHEVSLSVFLSKNYFCTLFRKEVGENFVSFLQRIRVEKAKIFLREYHYRVREVADLVGFENGRYFSSVFHKYTGMSPTQYREGAL